MRTKENLISIAEIAIQNRAQHSQKTSADGSWIRSRIVGPGAVYNLGNLLALFGGMALYAMQVPEQVNVQSAVYQYLMGSPGAVWLTLSMIIFLVSGEIYHQAYQPVHKGSQSLVQLADFISGLAAIALTVALLHLGDVTFALIAGILLAGGKLGSALLPWLGWVHEARICPILRGAVVLSRLPSILSLAWAIQQSLQTGQPWQDIALPTLMTISFLLWLWADILLIRQTD